MGWEEDLAEIKKLSIKGLIAALSDSDKCGFAAAELGEIGSASADEQADLEEGDPKRVSSAVEPLIKLLDKLIEEDDEDRYEAARALAMIADPRALDGLIRAYKNTDYGTRNVVAWGLGRIGDERAEKTLVEMLDDEHEYVRDSAAEALKEMGKPVIKQKAEHSEAEDSQEDKSLPKEELIDKLIEDLKSEDEKVCYSAVDALGETGDERAIIPIINFARRSLWVHGSFFFDTTRTINDSFENDFCEKLAFGIRRISDQVPSNADVEKFIGDLYDVWNTIKNWSEDIYIDGKVEEMWPDIDLDSGPHCSIVKVITILEEGNGKRMQNIIHDIREIVDEFLRKHTENQGIREEEVYFATCSIHLLGWIHNSLGPHGELENSYQKRGSSLDLISEPEKDKNRLNLFTAGIWDNGTLFWPDNNDEFTEEELEKFIDNSDLFFVDDEIIEAAEDALEYLE